MSGTLFVVATPIGNLEDVTARALRILSQVTLIAAEDTRRTHHLLSRYAITTPTISLHEHNEGQRVPALVERLRQGEKIALVSDAGTPTISDPGQRLIKVAIEAGIRVEPVPGPSAVVSAFAASGIAGQSFTFLGFPPVRSKDRKTWLAELADAGRPVVFFEAPHRIKKTFAEIIALVGDINVSVARELTKIHEEFIRGSMTEVLARLGEPIGEFTVVIDIGHTTDVTASTELPSPVEMAMAFGQMVDSCGGSRRLALSRLARTHGISTNQVYALVEAGKKLA